MNTIKSDRGAIVIEATLSLTTFLFAILTVYSMFHVSLAQARISSALNASAKEISEYSYVYDLTGLNEKQKDKVSSKTGSAQNEIDDNLSDVHDLYSAFEGIKGVISGASRSSETQESFLYYIFNQGIEKAKGEVFGLAARSLMEKHLGPNPDAYLRKLGVVNGINGLECGFSQVFPDGTGKDIVLVVDYQVSVIKLLNFDYVMDFELSAKTRAWVGSTN